MDNKSNLVKNWFIKALHDLAVSKKLKNDEQYLDVAIYHCQQAAEKAIKGFLVLHDTAKLWNAETGKEEKTLTGHKGAVLYAAFSADGKRAITGSIDCSAKIWDIETGRELLTLEGHSGPVSTALFSPEGTRVVTGSRDRTAFLWSI